jgi:hypothetical protein
LLNQKISADNQERENGKDDDQIEDGNVINSIVGAVKDGKDPGGSPRALLQEIDHVVDGEAVKRKRFGVAQVFNPPDVELSKFLMSLEITTLAIIC